MKNYVLRHGQTDYKQGNIAVSIDDANDILDEAKPQLRASADEIYERSKKQGMNIHSSPLGRALASAKEVYSRLEEIGAKPGEIIPTAELAEVKGMSYFTIMACVNGGEFKLNGNIYELDKSITNPDNLDPFRFFRADIINQGSYQKKLPKEIADIIKEFETSKSAEKRLQNVIYNTEPSIKITHEGLTGKYFTQLTGDDGSYLDRGRFIELEKEKICGFHHIIINFLI